MHEALEDFYEGLKPYEHISETLEATIFRVLTIADFKFNNSDSDKNSNIEEKYIACMRHFAKNHQPVIHKVHSEKFVTTTLKDGDRIAHFMGYIDSIHIEDGILYVTDYKTSTRYTGEKLTEHATQLLLNSLGISQTANIPMSKIRARWNFLKYCIVSYELKNKSIKETVSTRHDWVDKMKVSIRKKLTDMKLGELEIDIMMGEAIANNNLDKMPESIRNAYTLADAYIYADMSDEAVAKMTRKVLDHIDDIKAKEDADSEDAWAVKVEDKDSYFCSQLCGFRMICPHYKEYLDERGMFLTRKDEQEAKDETPVSDENTDWIAQMFS